ncbi:DNA polymerase III subunit delta' [Sulfuriflexus sp.]|uniref:DNA polymerase III subunit delta' n=1 Tax=Sulfuriflexus sp. TaxID=2015443 RepID=UPI0028CCBA61|nr:DNA polymerase III subunit delta' [Sulfuriflexus sp.]MDT8404192.1 DNA polymerase III subunit delta' [Sulfuriflexus sp.]
MSYLPWQAHMWQQLQQRRHAGRLPHALLLSGPAGTGKLRFATAFAESLLCSTPGDDGSACGHCKACELVTAGSHPDWTTIAPEEAGKAIKVDQIRSLADFTSLHAHYGGSKVVTLQPVEQMNHAAANSLLKTLEEPSANTVLLLVTANPQRLLPTIRSRCQVLHFECPPRAEALAWLTTQLAGRDGERLLEIAAGAPVMALELADSDLLAVFDENFASIEALLGRWQDPLQVASQWHKQDGLRTLHWFSGWVTDMIRLASTDAPPHLDYLGLRDRLQALAKELELSTLHRFLEQLNEARRLLATSQVNSQLLFEELLVRWSALPRR